MDDPIVAVYKLTGTQPPVIGNGGNDIGIGLLTDKNQTVLLSIPLPLFKMIAAQFEQTARQAQGFVDRNSKDGPLTCPLEVSQIDVAVVPDVSGATLILHVSEGVRYLTPVGPRLAADLANNLQRALRTHMPRQGKPS